MHCLDPDEAPYPSVHPRHMSSDLGRVSHAVATSVDTNSKASAQLEGIWSREPGAIDDRSQDRALAWSSRMGSP